MQPPIAGSALSISRLISPFEVSACMKPLFQGIVCCHVPPLSRVVRAVPLYSAHQPAPRLLLLSISLSVASPPCSTRCYLVEVTEQINKSNHTCQTYSHHNCQKAELGAWWLAYRALTRQPWSHYRCFLLFHFLNLSTPTDCITIGSTGKNMVAGKKSWGLVRRSGGRMTPSPSTGWSPTTALRRSLRS